MFGSSSWLKWSNYGLFLIGYKSSVGSWLLVGLKWVLSEVEMFASPELTLDSRLVTAY